ncbi:hypothetical protein R6V09_01190 [Streptomyces sp. W16]|uniref:DUF6907 domain-containing protein n=1 Tax=Streptomyces sp. W16 TaxID=3076631 RepID=UPI00295B051F|nr:hypothetical protein [Streptomyces sp. W16]MDV9168758.1 hypothetical protein [Streptomyces sp. W16]
MPEPRMVDVTIIETRVVPIPEPDWCTDPHDGAQHFTDLTHRGRETSASVDTPLGTARFLVAQISHAPYLVSVPEPHPVVSVSLDLEADFTAEAIPGVAARLREAADLLDEAAAEAIRLRGDAS